jgi:hypothetical protein
MRNRKVRKYEGIRFLGAKQIFYKLWPQELWEKTHNYEKNIQNFWWTRSFCVFWCEQGIFDSAKVILACTQCVLYVGSYSFVILNPWTKTVLCTFRNYTQQTWLCNWQILSPSLYRNPVLNCYVTSWWDGNYSFAALLCLSQHSTIFLFPCNGFLFPTSYSFLSLSISGCSARGRLNPSPLRVKCFTL